MWHRIVFLIFYVLYGQEDNGSQTYRHPEFQRIQPLYIQDKINPWRWHVGARGFPHIKEDHREDSECLQLFPKIQTLKEIPHEKFNERFYQVNGLYSELKLKCISQLEAAMFIKFINPRSDQPSWLVDIASLKYNINYKREFKTMHMEMVK